MSKNERVLLPQNMIDISKELDQHRRLLLNGFEDLIAKTIVFALDVSRAIGEISVSEAKQGIKDFFCEEMDKI